jgi:hypothetical protein
MPSEEAANDSKPAEEERAEQSASYTQAKNDKKETQKKGAAKNQNNAQNTK